MSDNISQIHAVLEFWRARITNAEERDAFEAEVRRCLQSDLKSYWIRTKMLSPDSVTEP